MTEHGLPSVDGAIACPFVAFEGDRDSRATGPDHLHRCYAEVRPAPRALAHQQAYCLSSAFAVCPTFQDWARREAAQARSDSLAAAASGGAGESSESPDRPAPDGERSGTAPGSERNPPRDWASPPPWMGGGASERTGFDDAASDDQPDVIAIPTRGGGLAGSFADRIANQPSGQPADRGDRDPGPPADAMPAAPVASPAWREPAHGEPAPQGRLSEGHDSYEEPAYSGQDEDVENRTPGARQGRANRAAVGRTAPSWERIPRREAYPTLKTRMALSGISMPPIMLAVAAVVIAAVALFVLPAILGVGNPPATSGPSQSASPSQGSASATPIVATPVPQPTQQIYVVQSGDTMSRIANRFGVPLATLCEANKTTIPDCNKVVVGANVIIPAVAPTTVPGASTSPVPAASQ
ncbi:MAG: LysM peptidoglycan-binding domain-containing protein [Chloroflexota bacterium]